MVEHSLAGGARMIAGFVWIFFLSGAAINVHMLARTDVSRLDFLDGVLIGQAYYVILPLAVILVTGRSEAPDLLLTYLPYEDLGTTGMLISGMFLFPTLRVLVPRIHVASRDSSDPAMASAVVVLFLVTTLCAFVLSGLAHGGHWQGNLEEAFRNPAFLPVKYAANVARNAVFAVLLYQVTTGRTTAGRAMLVGLAFALVDVFTTFNRITAVYLIVMSLLLLKRGPARTVVATAAAAAIALPFLAAASALWPAFRGLATVQGYSAASLTQAWQTAGSAGAAAPATLDGSLNAVFESSNIVVLDWIVQNYGSVERPFLAFAMFARPFTLLLPAAAWPGRPQNFGLELGEGIAHIPSLALNSTLYGESYANFGWFWPLGLSAFLLLWHGAYRLIAPNARVVQMMGAFAAIAIWRFDASFVGCAVLVTAALVCGLRAASVMRFRPVGRFYFLTATGAVSAVFLAGQML